MLSCRENDIITLLSKKYKFNKEEAIEIINNNFKIIISIEESPTNSLISLVESQYYKEYKNNIWKDSIFFKLPQLQSNNIGSNCFQILYISYNQLVSNLDNLVV